MGYYHGEQSVGLKPILITVSVITAVLFGGAYFLASSNSTEHPAVTQPQPSAPEQIQQSAPAPAAPANKKPINAHEHHARV
ncbi:MAG TPA: hypothetical protein V6C72_07385 [Chroococcales cyanobacterium]